MRFLVMQSDIRHNCSMYKYIFYYIINNYI
uniref:Uncharacterized protein n=1 Tax=Myoviridae sp. ctkfK18 TaxID=2825165 RepID=A0A8S5VH56_9CAUD|nr:MAG TPA: hypothetical protein [Myoviridae sp. ctkfK18]